MKEHQIIRRWLTAWVAVCLAVCTPLASAQTLDEVLGVRSATTVDGRNSQTRIDQLQDDTHRVAFDLHAALEIKSNPQSFPDARRWRVRVECEGVTAR